MIESKIFSQVLKKNIINNYNYLINKNYNIIIKIFMDKIVEFKKKNYFYFVYVKKINNHLTYNLNLITKEILIFLTNKIERKFA